MSRFKLSREPQILDVDGIKYYSGTATYTSEKFALPESLIHNPPSAIYLDLGEVKNVAQVRLNGKDLGVLWTRPFRVEITGAVQPAGNLLEILVTNLWPNRLIGDAALPTEQRLTRTHVCESQELYSARVPIVRTRRVAEGLEIVEEAFAVTDLRQPELPVAPLQRVDVGGANRDWATPPAAVDTSLRHIAVHMGGSIFNGLWVFTSDTPPDTAALLAGKLNSVALARMSTTSLSGPARNDVIIVRVTNTGPTATFFVLYSGGGSILTRHRRVATSQSSADQCPRNGTGRWTPPWC